MVKTTTCPNRFVNSGFTLIELLIVMVITGILAVIAFMGLRPNSQNLSLAQKDLVTNLRGIQNQVNNGTENVKSAIFTNGASYYNVAENENTNSIRQVDLPAGVTVTSNSLAVCFSNQNLAKFDSSNKCYSSYAGANYCESGTGYICTDTNVSSPNNTIITLTDTTGATRQVIVEGSGMVINRIYAPTN